MVQCKEDHRPIKLPHFVWLCHHCVKFEQVKLFVIFVSKIDHTGPTTYSVTNLCRPICLFSLFYSLGACCNGVFCVSFVSLKVHKPLETPCRPAEERRGPIIRRDHQSTPKQPSCNNLSPCSLSQMDGIQNNPLLFFFGCTSLANWQGKATTSWCFLSPSGFHTTSPPQNANGLLARRSTRKSEDEVGWWHCQAAIGWHCWAVIGRHCWVGIGWQFGQALLGRLGWHWLALLGRHWLALLGKALVGIVGQASIVGQVLLGIGWHSQAMPPPTMPTNAFSNYANQCLPQQCQPMPCQQCQPMPSSTMATNYNLNIVRQVLLARHWLVLLGRQWLVLLCNGCIR